MKLLKTCGWLLLAFTLQSLTGCVSVKMSEPTPSMANLEKLRAANLAPVKAGSFILAPGKNAALDRGVSGLRGSSVTPANGSFAQQLRSELVTELKAAGLYDEAADVVIKGELTNSQVDAAIGTGTAKLSARFIIQRAEKTVYDKELSVNSSWESSFVGAIAIPEAINQYTALYKQLIGKLFDDREFKSALARQK
ncbi:hypothetical protein [Methylophilus sp.]|uniref:hypothetical protein n=1 Tax=Methylophilus sp. TaxID=29541 RepID=UPI0040354142